MAPSVASTSQPGARADRATVAAGFVTGMLSAVPSPLPLLRAAGIAPSVLHEGGARVPIGAYVTLYNLVVRALGDEGFGLFPAPVRPGAFEFLCRGTVGSRTMGEALDRAARFLGLVLPELAVSVERSGPTARLVVAERTRLRRRAGDPRRVFAFEWVVRLLHGLACWLAGCPIALEDVRFPFPRPPHAADYALVYAERCAFDADTLTASFDASVLDLPVVRAPADVDAFLEGAPGRISMLYRRDRETVRRVREHLERTLSDAPGLDATARSLGLSPRTLHRRLRDEGASFRSIRADLRRERALARLERTREPIADIAAELGYSEPSAFFRAFHGWTGEAPSARRKRARGARSRNTLG